MLDSLNINIVTKSALLSDTYPLIVFVLPFNVEPIVFAICVPCNCLAKALFFWLLFNPSRVFLWDRIPSSLMPWFLNPTCRPFFVEYLFFAFSVNL